MDVALRVVAACLTVSLLLAGPLAPLAGAQQPSTPPAQPAGTPAPPAPPTAVLPETLKSSAPQEYRPTGVEPPMPSPAYDVAAGVATAFLVPGRVVTCIVGSGLGLVTLAVSLGTGYRFATSMLEEGCGGKWIVRGEDLLPTRPPISDRTYGQ